MIETSTPRSPGWWIARLAARLESERQHFDRLDAYYRGDTLPPTVQSRNARQAYQQLCSTARLNLAELVVEATRERMLPVGFRTGADGDEVSDAVAWRIWQSNSLDSDSAELHRMSLVTGTGFVIVGSVDEEIRAPLISIEDPREVTIERDPRRRRRPMAALKLFRDDVDGVDRAYLFLPGYVVRARSAHPTAASTAPSFSASSWVWDGEAQALPTKSVPVVDFPNRWHSGRPWGEYEPHTAHLDRVNGEILRRIQIATLQAFRQRAIKGVPNADEHGDQIDYSDIFRMDPAALWLLPATADLWESGQVDLGPIRQAIRDDIQDLAAVTRTPLFYLAPDAASGSAEGASLAREGLVFKVRDRITQAGEGWERVMQLAFEFAGDAERAARPDLEVLWSDPERHSMAERYDAASKAQAAGVPWRQVMQSILQFSPQETDRMESERLNDQLFAASLVLPPAAATPQQQTTTQQPAAAPAGMTPTDMAAAANALGQLIRAGVEPGSAAAKVGLDGLNFTGAVPVSLRLPDADAADLEEA